MTELNHFTTFVYRFMLELRLFFVAIIAVTFFGCSNTTEPSTPPRVDKLLINSASDAGYTVEVYSDVAITVGYNPLYVRVKHNGVTLSDVHMTVVPDMNMGVLHHSSPAEQPEDVMSDKDGLYRCAVIFTMPGTTQWKLGVTIHDHSDDTTVTVHIPVSVATSGNVQIVKDTANTKYVFTLLSSKWMVGMNDVKFNVYRTTDGFDYTPVDDASLKMVPTMPSMGHGSMGNVHPSSDGNGWYTGRANFTMTGDWQLELTTTALDAQTLTTKYQIVVL